MATSSTYYLNAPSLGSATAVFTDDTLLVLAADGFYSDGVISREQVSGVLLPQQTCPSCLSYNCIEGVCTDPGDGSGTYATLEECELACSPPPPTGYEYRLFGYAADTADACGQTGTYVDLGTLTVYASSPTLSGVTLFYNTYPPLATPYINSAIGNGDRILFALASNTAEKWSGVYNNVTGEISSNVDCTP